MRKKSPDSATCDLAVEQWLDLMLSIVKFKKGKLPPKKIPTYSPKEEFEKRIKGGTYGLIVMEI